MSGEKAKGKNRGIAYEIEEFSRRKDGQVNDCQVRRAQFLAWKAQMRSYLFACGWFGTIDGSLPYPSKGPAEKVQEWLKIDARAQAVILNGLERSVVRCVMTLSNAYEMWTSLTTLYESRCKVSLSLLLREFHANTMTEDMDMATHIANVESMAHRLSDLGKIVDESDIMAKLLNLPRKFRHLLSAWDSVDPKLQTRDELIPRLLKEERLEMSEEKASGKETSDSVAFAAKTKQGSAVSSRASSTGTAITVGSQVIARWIA